MTGRRPKGAGNVIKLDDKREAVGCLVVCLYEDCFATFESRLINRKDAITELFCPKCSRNRLLFITGPYEEIGVTVHFGRLRRQ